jgi:hypothetical protein
MEAEDQSVVEVVLRLQGPWIVDKDTPQPTAGLKHGSNTKGSTGSQWPAFEIEPSEALQCHAARAGAIRCDGPVRSYVDTLRCARGPPRRLESHEAGRNSLDHHDQDLTYLRLPRHTNLAHYTCALASTVVVVVVVVEEKHLAPAMNIMRNVSRAKKGKARTNTNPKAPWALDRSSCGDQGTRCSANRCLRLHIQRSTTRHRVLWSFISIRV